MRLYIFVVLFFSINNSIADEKQIDRDPIQKLQNKLDEFEEGFTQQDQTFDELNKLISQQQKAIGQIDKQQTQINEKFNYQALRKELLDRQENRIDTWLEVVALILTVFALLVPLGAFLLNRKINKNIQQQVKETENIKADVLGHVQEIEQLKQDVQQHIEEIEASKEKAHDHIQEISKLRELTAQQVADNPAEAGELIEQVDKTGSKVDQLIANAFQLQQAGNINTAIEKWQDILAIARFHEDRQLLIRGLFSLGYLFGEIGNYEESVNYYKEGLKEEPSNAVALGNLGTMYLKQEETDSAILALQSAIGLRPDYDLPYTNLATAYLRKGDVAKANEICRKAIALNPKSINSYVNLLEIDLILGSEIDKNLLAKCKQDFRDNLQFMMALTMLELFSLLNKENKLFTKEFKKEFNEKYSACSLTGWDWQPLERWISEINNNDALLEALEFFKKF